MRLGPAAHAKVFYVNCKENVDMAVEKRICEKQRPPTMTADDKRRIMAFTEAMKTKVFTRQAVKKAMFMMGTIEGGQSKKWTDERFQRTMADLMAEVTPEYKLKASVKNEAMNPSKAPRMLIADGDAGQVMAVGVLKVLELVMFKKLKSHCIKEKSKEQAMEDIAHNLNVVAPDKYQTIIEGDGSAWDTTCSLEIRDMTENPLIDHIVKLMRSLGWPYPESWEEAHKKINTALKYKTKHMGKTGPAKFEIASIRRSGHRGTSSLNFVVNFILTHVAIMDTPHANKQGQPGGYLDDTTRHGVDRWKIERQLFAAFEGDDSIVAVSGAITDDQCAEIEGFWHRAGFNMKLFRRRTLAEFTGWKLPLDDHGRVRVDCVVPDVTRTVNNAAWTTSSSALEEVRRLGKGGPVTAKVAAASMFCYKLSMVKLPTLYNMFQRWEDEYKKDAGVTEVDHEMMSKDQKMKAFGDVEKDKAVIPTVSPNIEHEYTILRALGLVRDQGHWKLWAHSIDQLTTRDPDAVAKAVPWGSYLE